MSRDEKAESPNCSWRQMHAARGGGAARVDARSLLQVRVVAGWNVGGWCEPSPPNSTRLAGQGPTDLPSIHACLLLPTEVSDLALPVSRKKRAPRPASIGHLGPRSGAFPPGIASCGARPGRVAALKSGIHKHCSLNPARIHASKETRVKFVIACLSFIPSSFFPMPHKREIAFTSHVTSCRNIHPFLCNCGPTLTTCTCSVPVSSTPRTEKSCCVVFLFHRIPVYRISFRLEP
ncbi:hypothetical protein B0T26DRAFT_109792 [Lasiosphaeria miniovina]|uniref:Uncharacterized protein n=1 Tax=Lasiosphaeria miniovina TaxID=1954250 RepID=A0AA40B3H0_9PEZI|nr:uncharacterized protein B0T26DRAFT_109792 [Lasiosphaeria miniovina]KAK0726954.1 hypothetical protein B0T26DRAFT_109792 [Lasiosphaeria miniovina]